MDQEDSTNKHTTSGNAIEVAELEETLDTNASELQKLLAELDTKTKEAECGAVSTGSRNSQIADAYKDMDKIDRAMDSFESKLDGLLQRIDNLVETKNSKTQQQQQQKP